MATNKLTEVLNDEELILKAKKDSKNFTEIYLKYYQNIFNYFYYALNFNKELAQDLTQEVFFKAFKNLKNYKFQGFSYLSYLQKIAHNLLVNYYKKQKTLPLQDENLQPTSISEKIIAKSALNDLLDEIQKLRPNYREVILMKYQNGLKIKEIAQILNKSENAVKLILSRARKKLKNSKKLEVLSKIESQTVPSKISFQTKN